MQFSIDKDARKRVFLFGINKRIRKVLSERTRCSFGSALYKSPGIRKLMHCRIPHFLKPSLTFRIESNSKTIHSMAMENTLTSTQNQHRFRKKCLENSCIVRKRRKIDGLSREYKETEGHKTKGKESRK